MWREGGGQPIGFLFVSKLYSKISTSQEFYSDLLDIHFLFLSMSFDPGDFFSSHGVETFFNLVFVQTILPPL